MFWEQIRANQRKTAALVVAMAALLFVLGYVGGEAIVPGGGPAGLGIAFLVWMVLSLVSYFSGDDILLALSGARRIRKEDHPRLWNVVEEMKIASGAARMPDIYIIDDPSPNAFAAGRSPEHAAVAVTSGLLNMCNRDELQGVVAHEMAHIQNRDALLMIVIGVMVGSIIMLSDALLRIFWYTGGGRRRSRTSRESGGQAQLVLLLIALILAILAPLLARVIYMAVSRRREYLADACAVRYTRYPEGLASALEKIGRSLRPMESANRVTAPMYIVNPLRNGKLNAHSLFATHPPIEERVRILRSIAGGAGFVNYEEAFQRVTGQTSLLPASALTSDHAVPLREAAPPEPEEAAPHARKQRVRETTDALWKTQGYRFVDCSCGVRLKVPPELADRPVRCPACGTVHPLPAA